MTVQAIHSASADVYHDHHLCSVAADLVDTVVLVGTGGKKHCRECAKRLKEDAR